MTSKNLYAVLLGIKSAVTGGSGKVIDSKPNDRIFIYFSDHGGPGVLGKSTSFFFPPCNNGSTGLLSTWCIDIVNSWLGMPNMPYLYAVDFIEVLKKKHAMNSYKEMVSRVKH